MSRRPWRTLAALAVAGVLACGPAEDDGGSHPGPSAGRRSGEPPRHLVIVVVDTLRADHLGCYGYEEDDVSPRIDALAADAVRFQVALAPAPWTLPSLATLMTGLYPSLHGARRPSNPQDLGWLFTPDEFQATSALHDSHTTLAEVLRAEGFATGGFVQGAYPSSPFGIAQGFEVYEQNATPGMRFDIENALRWIDEGKAERFFLYLHTVEVHAPYAPIEIQPAFDLRRPDAPMDYFERGVAEERARFEELDRDPGYRGKVDGSVETLGRLGRRRAPIAPRDLRHLVALYDRGIAYTDYWIGTLIDGLTERGLIDRTAFLLTSDHGEEFREHGGLEHSHTYYEEMLRVPLVLRVPGEGSGAVVSEPVGLVDVLPTLLDVLGIETAAQTQGRSLRPLWLGERLPERVYFGEASMTPGRKALRTGKFKYVRNRGAADELYDLSEDPDEQRNRCTEDGGDRCARFREMLTRWENQSRRAAGRLARPEPAAVDEALEARLRELGYIDRE